jgi:GNAT superfamily N-acetyltransferase
MQMKQRLRELEEAVVDAWPAADTADLDGWLLRASGGPTHRGNSVATLDADARLALDARIERTEAWYRERQRAAMFQIGPCVAPVELDHELVQRGYRKEGEAVAAVASPAVVRNLCDGELRARIEAKASPAWLALALGTSRFATTREVFQGFLARLGSRCRFATAFDAEGEPSASCLAISSEDRLGVYAMFSQPSQRRRGAARALLRELAQAALDEQMRELYLLVETANAPARALYARSGFQDLYQYHYRVRDGQG